MNLSTSLKIGTIFRTRLRIHYTWLLVFLLIPWTVSTQFSVETSLITRVLLGVVTAVLFFCAVMLREFVLLIIAGAKDIHLSSVTIFAFGGVIQTDSEHYTPQTEMLLTVSGMLCNLAITGIFYFTHLIFGTEVSLILGMPFKWLAFFYLTLSLFHLLPIYPLEGGRLLHVILWRLTKKNRTSTFIASVSGWFFGFLVMIGAIILVMFTAERFTGMFFIGLGLIIQNAATHGFRFARLMPGLRKPAVKQVPIPEIADYISEDLDLLDTNMPWEEGWLTADLEAVRKNAPPVLEEKETQTGSEA